MLQPEPAKRLTLAHARLHPWASAAAAGVQAALDASAAADRSLLIADDPARARIAVADGFILAIASGDDAIARDVARGHGGDVTLDRSELGGLKATIRIPGAVTVVSELAVMLCFCSRVTIFSCK
jgi:hypothetical protein